MDSVRSNRLRRAVGGCAHGGPIIPPDPIARDLLSEFAAAIAFNGQAHRRRQALAAETVVELEVTVADDHVLSALSAHPSIPETARIVAHELGDDDGLVGYLLETADVDAETLVAAAEDTEGIERATKSTGREAGTVVQVGLEPPTVGTLLGGYGGVVRSITTAEGEVTLRVQFPRLTDVSRVVETIRDQWPTARMHSRQERTAERDRPSVFGSVTITITGNPAKLETVVASKNTDTHTVSDDFSDNNSLVATVRLYDEYNNTIPDAAVNLTDDGSDIEINGSREQRTDDDGELEFEVQSTTPQDNVSVTLTELASGQNLSTSLEGISWLEAGPQAEASANSYTVNAGANVTFRAGESHVPAGSNPDYDWEFEWDNGSSVETASGLTNTTSFPEPATINTTLTVAVANESDTDTFSVDVEDPNSPEAHLEAPETVPVGESFDLDATDSDDEFGITDFAWDFGNGTTASGETLEETTANYTDPGEYDVELTVTDTSGNTDTNTTTILAEGANATVRADGIDFGQVPTNATSSESITFSNDGTADLNVTESAISGENASAFEVLGDDEPAVRPGETRSLTVAFEPDEATDQDASLEITTENNTGANDFEIDLAGEGVTTDLETAASRIEFGEQALEASLERNVTVENEGDADATLEQATILGSDADNFAVEEDLPTIDAGETANVTVTFEPVTVGDQRATLAVETAEGDSTRVALDGTGVGPQLYLPTDDRSAGSIGSGTETTISTDLRNYGSEPLNVTDLALGETEVFDLETDAADLEVDPDDEERVDVRFAPEEPGEYDTTLAVSHNDTTVDTAEIDLSGEALAGDIDVDRTTLDFGNTTVGEPAFLNVTITNQDNAGANLTVDSTSIVGEHADDFSVETPERPFVVEPGEQRELQVNFTALAEGQREAQLQLNSDANQGQTNVWLTNTRSYIVVQEVSNPTVNVDGNNLENGRTRLLNVPTPSTRQSAVTVDELGFEMNRPGDFEMELLNSESAVANDFDADSETEVVQYVGIDHVDHLANETFDDTSLVYRVDADALPAGTDADEVAIHRFDETSGEYVELDADVVDERGGEFHYEVETPGFSEFVVTAHETEPGGPSTSPSPGQSASPSPSPDPESAISITTASLESTTITDGEAAVVAITLENEGETDGEQTVELVADGDVVSSETIAVDAESTTNSTLSFVTAAPGEYDLTVGDVQLETLTVVAGDAEARVDDASDDADDTAAEPERETEDGISGWALVVTGLVAGALLLVVLWRRRDAEDESASA